MLGGSNRPLNACHSGAASLAVRRVLFPAPLSACFVVAVAESVLFAGYGFFGAGAVIVITLKAAFTAWVVSLAAGRGLSAWRAMAIVCAALAYAGPLAVDIAIYGAADPAPISGLLDWLYSVVVSVVVAGAAMVTLFVLDRVERRRGVSPPGAMAQIACTAAFPAISFMMWLYAPVLG